MCSYWAKPDDCLDLARYLNDHITQVVSENPKRFVGTHSGHHLALSTCMSERTVSNSSSPVCFVALCFIQTLGNIGIHVSSLSNRSILSVYVSAESL